MEQLKQEGVDNINFKYRAWANRGECNTLFNRIDTIGALGSGKDLLELIDYTENNGINFYPDVDFSYAKTGAFFNMFLGRRYAARSIHNNIAFAYRYHFVSLYFNSDTARLIVSPNNYDRIIGRFLRDFTSFNFSNISVSNWGTDLNADYLEKNVADRQRAVQLKTDQLRRIKDSGYSISINGANAYALRYASYVNGVPMSSGKHYLFDACVPFYQIVLRGVIPYSSEPLNYSNDYSTDVLRLIETGTIPSFEWIYEDNTALQDTFSDYFGVHFRPWLNQAVSTHHEMRPLLSKIQGHRIIEHGKITDGVYLTKYDNDIEIYVNYNPVDVEKNGIIVHANSFVIRGE